MGTVGLVSAALALAFLAGVNIYTRDSNVLVTPDLAPERTAAARVAPAFSLWPLVFAFGAVTIVVGLVTYQAITIIGLAPPARRRRRMDDPGLVRAGLGRQRAQRRGAQPDRQPVRVPDRRCRRHRHHRLLVQPHHAVAVEDQHRARLRRPGASIFLAFAFLFAYRPSIKHRAVVSVIVIGAIGLVAGGAAAGISGEREIEQHETDRRTGAPRASCEDPEETHADEKASQSVAATASVAARITLAEDGTLSYERQRTEPAGRRTTRSRSPAPARTTCCSSTSPTSTAASRSTSGTMADRRGRGRATRSRFPHQVCTTLVEHRRRATDHPQHRAAQLRVPRRLPLLRARRRNRRTRTGRAVSHHQDENAVDDIYRLPSTP